MRHSTVVIAFGLCGLLAMGLYLFASGGDAGPKTAEAGVPRIPFESESAPSRSTAAKSTPATPTKVPPGAADPSARKRPNRSAIDAKRHAIRESLSSRGSSSAEREPESEPDENLGKLDKEYIRTAIRESLLPVAKECYESELEQVPDLAGKIVMKFEILGDDEVGGVVDNVDVDEQSTLPNEALRECMRESLYAVEFPAPQNDGKVFVTYPFVFAPG